MGGIFFHLAYTKGQPKPGKKLTRFARQSRGAHKQAEARSASSATVWGADSLVWLHPGRGKHVCQACPTVGRSAEDPAEALRDMHSLVGRQFDRACNDALVTSVKSAEVLGKARADLVR
jgi:hypothetical protein